MIEVLQAPRALAREFVTTRFTFNLITSVFIAVCILPVLIVAGMSLADGFKIAAALAAQFFVGFTFISALKIFSDNCSALIAIALPFGMAVSAFTYLLILQISGWHFGWLIPTAFALLIVMVNRRRPFVTSIPTVAGLAIPALTLIPGLISLLIIWREVPLRGSPWWSLNGDMPVHEAMSAALAMKGPSVSFSVLGDGLPYHWLADAWVGICTQTLNLPPYFCQSRVLPTVVLFGTAAGIWALFSSLSVSWPIKFFAVVTATGAGILTSGVAHAGSLLFEPYSPTFQFATMALVALAIVVTRTLQAPFEWRAMLLVIILTIIVATSRTSHLAIAAGGLFAIVSVALYSRQRRFVALASSMLFLLSGVLSTYFLLQFTTHASSKSGWQLGTNADLPSLLALVPFNGTLGVGLSIVACLLAVLLPGAGVVWFLTHVSGQEWSLAWCLGATISGVIGVFFSHQIGYSHLSLLYGGAIFLYAASGAGAALSAQWLMDPEGGNWSRTRFFVLTFAIFLLAVIAVIVWSRLEGFQFDGFLRFVYPFVIAAICIGLAVVASRFRRDRTFSTVLSASCLGLVALGVGVNLVAGIVRLASPPSPPNPATSYSLTSGDIALGEWVRWNVPEDAVLATNRVCSIPDDSPPNCPSSVFSISALGHRQALIEGTSYGVSTDLASEGPEFDWARHRLTKSYSFGMKPDSESLTFLWNAGVRYFWVDHLVSANANWSPYAEVVFGNDRGTILRLIEPGTGAGSQNP